MADGNVALATKNKGGRPPKARGAANSSDAADARWTVRGVPVNVRSMAIKAAADRGATVGDWLAEAIVAHARADPAKVSADDAMAQADGKTTAVAVPIPQDLMSLLTDVQTRLAKVEAESSKPLLVRLFGRRS